MVGSSASVKDAGAGAGGLAGIICSRCVMDDTAAAFTIDEHGVCNYCRDFEEKTKIARVSIEEQARNRDALIRRIRDEGRGRDYDCVVGVSGGVDSSYVLYLAVKNGLRPLAVHLDNGWNSELAVHNINRLVTDLGVDLYTHVIDWKENRDLQRSFFAADVIDIEMLMDNAMLSLNYRMSRKIGIRWILSGSNTATEGMAMPSNWNWLKFDAKNVRSIQSRYGTVPIRTHRLISVPAFLINHYLRRIRWVPFLDYFDYRKGEAIDVLSNEVGYRPYLYKHYESVFTRFYQGFILPEKFGVDKRKLHFSTLIMSNQMSRDEAMAALAQSPYPDQEQLRRDHDFVLKKLGFSEEEFRNYLSRPPRHHNDFRSERWLWESLKSIRARVNRL